MPMEECLFYPQSVHVLVLIVVMEVVEGEGRQRPSGGARVGESQLFGLAISFSLSCHLDIISVGPTRLCFVVSEFSDVKFQNGSQFRSVDENFEFSRSVVTPETTNSYHLAGQTGHPYLRHTGCK